MRSESSASNHMGEVVGSTSPIKCSGRNSACSMTDLPCHSSSTVFCCFAIFFAQRSAAQLRTARPFADQVAVGREHTLMLVTHLESREDAFTQTHATVFAARSLPTGDRALRQHRNHGERIPSRRPRWIAAGVPAIAWIRDGPFVVA